MVPSGNGPIVEGPSFHGVFFGATMMSVKILPPYSIEWMHSPAKNDSVRATSSPDSLSRLIIKHFCKEDLPSAGTT